MAEPTMMNGTVTEVDVAKESFKLTEYGWVSHTKLEWRKGLGPPLSAGMQITFEGFQSKGRWYANNIALQQAVAAPAKSYETMQSASDRLAAAADMAQSASPQPEPPRIDPEPVSPGPGSFAYKDTIAIPKQVALKTAIELLVGAYGGKAGDVKDASELETLALNAMVVAEQFYEHFLNNSEIRGPDVATPDDLVPTPSEMAAPPPSWTGD